MFVDSDDKLCQGAVERLLKKAFEKNADVVAGNYRSISLDGKKIKDNIQFIDEKVNPKNYLSGYSWGKVFNNNLFVNLRFPEGYWYEDSINAQIVWSLAKNVYTISDIVYEYTKNPLGISKISRGKVKAIDSLYITELLMKDKTFFGLSLDSLDLEYFLHMVKLTYRRTSACNIYVAKSIFVVQCHLIQKFENLAFNSGNNYGLELALKNKDYRGYLKTVISK